METRSPRLTRSQSAASPSTMLASCVWSVPLYLFLSCIDFHCLAHRCATRAWRERWSPSTRRTSLTAPRWVAGLTTTSWSWLLTISLSWFCRITQKSSALSALDAKKQSPQRKERYFSTDKHEKRYNNNRTLSLCEETKTGRGTYSAFAVVIYLQIVNFKCSTLLQCLLLRPKPRVWGPWKRITTWNASSQLLKFSNLAKIGQIGRQRDKLMQNLLRLLADGVDASSPNKSNVIK